MKPARRGYAQDSPDWTVPTPLRALLWWPGSAFVLALVAPDAAVGSIAGAGLVLMALGAPAGAIGRRLTRAHQMADDAVPGLERVT